MTIDKIRDWARRINDAGKAVGNDGKPFHEHTSTIVGLSALILEATPDQSRTPELPEPVAWMSKSYCPWLNGGFAWVFSTCTVRPREESAPLYTSDQLREYGRACVAAALPQDHPECSGDPNSCPENEGYGCCNKNPQQVLKATPDVQEAEPVAVKPPSGDAEDAARYRWIRAAADRGDDIDNALTRTTITGPGRVYRRYGDLDAAIDAAMLARGDG